jgi:hypothetical protein
MLILRKVIKWQALALFAGVLAVAFTLVGWVFNAIACNSYDRTRAGIDTHLPGMRFHADRNDADGPLYLVLAVSGLFSAPAAEAWRLLCLLFVRQRALSTRAAGRQGRLLRPFDEVKSRKNIKVLGSGCRNCEITANPIAAAAKQAGV